MLKVAVLVSGGPEGPGGSRYFLFPCAKRGAGALRLGGDPEPLYLQPGDAGDRRCLFRGPEL